ncbi:MULTISPECIES: CapA family protein [Pseudoalteromonas]|uniref:Putative enzyme of poly-gamma-glutamate biosynthesis (Capsule formation) n=1 Tax=Pseudoalteromonas luteoviolacea (strain 2ta16) TaxID=1353533 RepID=V4JEM1_PSEL2|nr:MULTISPECIES: CapA family protein [Pseudoalteromonas]ESP93482.1 putative enzyme of poly-gamma-glutamate biosynthesis (capsule formation) [Pseudoalteromonas luteoviolacea 2ta16]KZN42473.1 hypothetical protein N483_11245 [Pseudoalteromonas luteoviolacea NCIMB 1944]MCG7548831.1 CapA family protein [Pseudoalteromonas sp. Of7M-16]
MSKINVIAAGDCFINRDLPKSTEFEHLAEFFKQADVRFCNFESTLCDTTNILFPAASSGGTWAQTHYRTLDNLSALGINTLSLANNHIMDYSHAGLQMTTKHLVERGFKVAGAGNNLREAAAPTYLETLGGRVAMVAATTTFHDHNRAGEQTPDLSGRPGLNPLRVETVHQISADALAVLKQIAQSTDINAELAYAAQKGSLISDDPDQVFYFGDYDFQQGAESKSIHTLNAQDVERIFQSIDEAKSQSDLVMVSLHSHQMKLGDAHTPPEFLQHFARQCIERGAHIFLGHGPHHNRGMEVYQGCPIFYGLGNFIFHNLTVTKQPWEMYELLGLKHENRVTDVLNRLDGNGSKGYKKHREYWTSFLPVCEFEHGKMTSLKIYPCDLGEGEHRHTLGTPRLSSSLASLETFVQLSRQLGTELQFGDDHLIYSI